MQHHQTLRTGLITVSLSITGVTRRVAVLHSRVALATSWLRLCDGGEVVIISSLSEESHSDAVFHCLGSVFSLNIMG